MVITTVTIDAPFLLANGFDKTWYDLEYPGVKAVYSDNGVSNEHHYINHGRHEGRYINAAMKSFFEEGTARPDFLAKRPYLITKTLPEDKIVVWLEYKSSAAAETAAAAARAAVAASAAAASLDYAATAAAARGVLESANTDAIAARADLVLVDEAAAAARADLAIADSNATAARLVLTNAIAAEKTANADARAADAATDAAARAAAATFSADARAAAALVSSNARASLVLVDEAAATARTALEAADSAATAARAALAGDIALKQDIISASNKLAQANVEGLVTALAGKQATIDSSNKLAQSNIEGLVASLGGKQATISNGGLNIVQVSGLQTALDAKQATISASNKVAQANVEGLVSALASSGNTSIKLSTEDAQLNGEKIVLDGVSAASRIDLTTAVFTTTNLAAASEFKFCNFKDSTTVKNLTKTGVLIDFTGSSFENVDFSGVTFASVAHVFKNCVFKGCDFRGAELSADILELTGCDFTNAIFGKVAATDTAFSTTNATAAYDFSKCIFKNANLKGCIAFNNANLIMNYADWSEALFDADSATPTNFTNVTNEHALGSKWHGLSVAPAAAKVVDAGDSDAKMVFEKMADGKYYGIAPWADLRNLDFSNHVLTQNLKFGSTDISATANLLRAGTVIGDKIAVPELKAGEYVAFGSARVDAIVDIDADTLAYALAFYGTSVSRGDIPQVEQQDVDKVAGITSSVSTVVHAQGSLAAYYFWMKNLSKNHFTGGSSDRIKANVLASTSNTARINGATTNAQQVTIKKPVLSEPVGLVGTFGDAPGVFQILGAKASAGPVAETYVTDATNFLPNAALQAAVKVGDMLEIHGDTDIETVTVSAVTTDDITVTRGTGDGSGGAVLALETAGNYSTNKATNKVVIHRRFDVTAATGGTTALLDIKASGQNITADAAYTSGDLAADLAGVTTALVAHHKSLNNGLKLDTFEKDGNTIAAPTGKAIIDMRSRVSKYPVQQMVGPDQDLTHMKDYQADDNAVPLTTAFDFAGAVLNDSQLSAGGHGTSIIMNVNLASVELANNIDLRNIKMGALTALKEAAGADFNCASITTATSGKVYGQNWYAKGIKGKLDLSVSGNTQVNNLYLSPIVGAECSGAFYGPGVDLTGETLSGTVGQSLTINVSMEDANMTNLTLKYINFSSGVKNAIFEGATMLKVDINGSIEGANFKNVSADGTSTTNRGLDLAGAYDLIATSVMPDFTGAQLAYATMPAVTGSATNKMSMTVGTARVNLSNAIWTSNHFKYVDMEGANLTGAHFQAATTTLTGSSFKNADLTNAKFKAADGTTALTNVKIDYGNWDGANITGMSDLLKADDTDGADTNQARLVNMVDNTTGADAASVQAKFDSAIVKIYKNGDGKFCGLPGTGLTDANNVGCDLSDFTLAGSASGLLSIASDQKMHRSNMKNFIMDYVSFGGTGAGGAMELTHTDATDKEKLKGFHIKNSSLNDGDIKIANVADDADAQCWDKNATDTDKATHLPSGAGTGTVLMLHGNSVYSGNAKTLTNNSMTGARMVGGLNHVTDVINYSGADFATYNAAGIMGADLSGDGFSGSSNLTDPTTNIFTGSTLPSAYKVVDNYLLGPGVTIGASGANVAVAADTDMSGIDLTGSSLHIAAGSGTLNLRNSTLNNVDFHASNLDAANISGATVNTTTDLSGIAQTASTKIIGRNIVNTFGAGKLPQGVTATDKYNYAQDGTELVGTIVA